MDEYIFFSGVIGVGCFLGLLVLRVLLPFLMDLISDFIEYVFKTIKDSIDAKTSKTATHHSQRKPAPTIKKKSKPYFGALQVRVTESSDEQHGGKLHLVELRGTIPVTQHEKIAISTHIVDRTDTDDKGKRILMPVISLLEEFQEKNTVFYQSERTGIEIGPGGSFVDWMPVSVVIPRFIQTARSGKRSLGAMVGIYPMSSPVEVNHGRFDSIFNLLERKIASFEFDCNNVGYIEAKENRDESRTLTIQIAVAVALSDSDLDDSEGETIRRWMSRNLELYEGDEKEEMRTKFNSALKEAYTFAEEGSLSLSDLCERLGKIGDAKSKFDTIELCMSVMAADGVAEPEEMTTIRKIADIIGFDLDDLQRIQDEKLISHNLTTSTSDPETVIGIDPSWSDQKKRKHLRSEFQKWNNRLNSLSAGEERDAAQQMLDLIAEIRTKYQ